MSVENVKKFIEKLADDGVMRSKISIDAAPEDLVAAAKAAGFDFSVEDLIAAQPSPSGVTELSDSDLEQVAGAGNFLWSLFGCKDKDPAPSEPAPADPGGDKPPEKAPLDPDLISVGIYSPEECGDIERTILGPQCGTIGKKF